MNGHPVSCLYHGCNHGHLGMPDPHCVKPMCFPHHIPEFVYVCPSCAGEIQRAEIAADPYYAGKWPECDA